MEDEEQDEDHQVGECPTASTKYIEEMQAQELNKLSTNEREQVLYEIHGVADAISEDDPTFVTAKLIEFDKEITRHSEKNSAYEQAASSSPKYVKKTEFRLQFLRGDLFDVVAAAKRMISYFQQKLELFGPDKLAKDITLQDFDEDDMKCLKTGYVRTITDRSGRAVICHAASLLGKDPHRFTVQNRLRALWYVYSSMIEDIDVQRQGFVWVNYGVGLDGAGPFRFKKEIARKNPKLVTALPCRAVGIHTCYNSSRWQILTHIAMMAGGKPLRTGTHLRVHYGTHKEVQSKLLSFGIPCDQEVFPIGPDGQPRINTRFLQQVEQWQERDEKASMMDTTQILPGPNDVLLGRQKLVQEHNGNLQFRVTANKFRDEYDKTKGRLGKTAISNKIVSMIKESNGRFLKMEEDSGCWVEVNDMTAREKVAHTFRNRRSNKSGGEPSSKKKSLNEQKQKRQQNHQQKPSKVRQRARVEESSEEEAWSMRPSKKQRRMEEQQEDRPSQTEEDDQSVGSTSSWLGNLHGFLFGNR